MTWERGRVWYVNEGVGEVPRVGSVHESEM